jgi:hypothetical protein
LLGFVTLSSFFMERILVQCSRRLGANSAYWKKTTFTGVGGTN